MTIWGHPNSEAETKLQARIDKANLTDHDYKNLYEQLWGACATDFEKWSTFEYITRCYLKDHHK
jgi:hypothetical protein